MAATIIAIVVAVIGSHGLWAYLQYRLTRKDKVTDELKKMNTKIDALNEKVDANSATLARTHILRFDDEIINGTKHSLEYWEQTLMDVDTYNKYADSHKDTYKNSYAEAAIRHTPANGTVLDLCTGSGCIAAAILANRTSALGTAVDLYPETLRAAEDNLTALGLAPRCTFVCGDATTDLFDPSVTFDVIVSNPPYVTADEMNDLEPELAYEPEHALTDGGDGLSILEKIIEIYQHHLTPDGVMILEHGWKQSDAVREIAAKNGMTHEKIMDYGGNIRGAVLKANS